MEFRSHAGGYMVRDGKTLLVHHKGFDKWTPPGGHIEIGETPTEALIREFMEETGMKIEIISALPEVFKGDSNATPLPAPFYMDVEREGFDVPHIGHYYYVKQVGDMNDPQHRAEEAHGLGWFMKEEIQALPTFDQVRAVASYAIDNYPKNL